MRKSRFSEEQVVGILCQADATSVAMFGAVGAALGAAAGASTVGAAVGAALVSQVPAVVASAALTMVAPHIERSGINSVAEGGFPEADAWAVAAMRKLGRDPMAALTLHGKLTARNAVRTLFTLTQERRDAFVKLLAPEIERAAAKPAG